MRIGTTAQLFLVAVVAFASYSCSEDENDPDVNNPPSPLLVTGGGQSTRVDFYHFTPKIVTPETTGDVILEMRNELFGSTNPVLVTATANITLKDDGKGGDKKASDQVFTGSIDSKLILSLNSADQHNRPFLGRIQFAQGFISIFAEVWNNNIPLVTVTPISSEMQKTAYLVNIATESTISPDKLTEYLKQFYDHFGDDYDFIAAIFPGFNLNRNFRGVKNDVMGIGISPFNFTSEFGSAGRLTGIISFPNTTYYDGASSTYQHELGHNWINFLRNTPFESGIPHWPLSDLANGIMGYSPGGGQGLQFPYNLVKQGDDTWLVETRTGAPEFSDMELYLMGFMTPAAVSTHIVFNNQSQTASPGTMLMGPVTTVTVNDLISALGQRVPNSTSSPKQFRIGTIIISNALLTAREMSFYEYYTKRAELTEQVTVKEGYSTYVSNPFFLSTGKRASIITKLVE